VIECHLMQAPSELYTLAFKTDALKHLRKFMDNVGSAGDIVKKHRDYWTQAHKNIRDTSQASEFWLENQSSAMLGELIDNWKEASKSYNTCYKEVGP